jgi:hypothetical protein
LGADSKYTLKKHDGNRNEADREDQPVYEKDASHFPATHLQPRTLPSSKIPSNCLTSSYLQHLPQAKKPSISPITQTKVTAH